MMTFSAVRPLLCKLAVGVRWYTSASTSNDVSYVQGQSPRKNLREYFYFVDHQGMRIRPNETDRYPEFPYVSLCGRERNYIRCDDTPLVFTHTKPAPEHEVDSGRHVFCYGHAGDLMHIPFQPAKLFMSPESGRVYHPCEERFGSVGLVMSKLAIEISPQFVFENGEGKPPTKFHWKERTYDLDNEWYFKYRSLDGCTVVAN